jgi:hypothetical protein
MQDQRITARKIASFAAPSEEEIAAFERLPPGERRALLRAEIERGFSGGVSDKSLDAIVADARARRAGNG